MYVFPRHGERIIGRSFGLHQFRRRRHHHHQIRMAIVRCRMKVHDRCDDGAVLVEWKVETHAIHSRRLASIQLMFLMKEERKGMASFTLYT